MIAHDAGGHASEGQALERNDVDAKARHDRGLFVLDVGELPRRWHGAVGEQLLRRDDAPTFFRLRRVFRRQLAKLHGLGHVETRDARKFGRRAAKIRRVVERGGIAVVVSAVPNDLEGPRIDLAGCIASGAERVATIAVARAPAVAIEVGVVVDDAVAIVIEVVPARFVLGKNLADASAPAATVGFAGLRAGLADTDVVGARCALITGLLLARNAGARSVLQNVPFTTVLRILVAVGETRFARSERTDPVDAQRRSVRRERTGILTEAAVVLVRREIVTTPRAARRTSLTRLQTRASRNARVRQTNRTSVAIGIAQTPDALERKFVAGLSRHTVVNAGASDFAHMRDRVAVGSFGAVVGRGLQRQTFDASGRLHVANRSCGIHGAISVFLAASLPPTSAAHSGSAAHPAHAASTGFAARARTRTGSTAGRGLLLAGATSGERCANHQHRCQKNRARHAHARQTRQCLHRRPHQKLRDRTKCTLRCQCVEWVERAATFEIAAG